MSFYYYQIKGGTEEWKAVPESRLHLIEEAMFSTILSVDSPVREDYTKEEYASIKYQGPLYFDLDDAESPASTSIHALALLEKLEKEGVNPKMCCISASGGKGFHITVDPKCFVEKQSKSGTTYLPQIYKEMAFKLAVESLDLRVYTARKGRMFRRCNVLRPNNLYKVRISYEELLDLANMAKVDAKKAEAFYKALCSDIRTSLKVELMEPELAPGLTAMYAECLEKVNKFTRGTKKAKKVNLPQTLPSFDAMLRGEGIKQDAGFQHLALQIGIIAHMKGITCDALITAADGLVKNHKSDGSRYNSASKRKAELVRMWHYTSDNPCYTYSAKAVVSLLNHSAPDLQGMEATDAEIRAGIENPEAGVLIAEDEYEHAGVTLTARGAYTVTEFGPKKLTAVGFENVTELVSTTNNTISTIQADVYVAGKHVGNKVMDLETFNSVSSINKMSMPYGQSFSGSDTQARGVFMRLVEKARKTRSRMYAVHREGLDIVNIPFHEDEDIRKEFFVWSDVKSVTPEPRILEKNLRLKFVGFPTENGQFQTDLSQAPSLPNWLKEPENKDRLRKVMDDILSCQSPEHIGKLMGWMVACNYRMLFHKNYGKFPLLHINGAAGQGKTEMTKLLSQFHYYKAEPKVLTPTSTLFAVSYAASGSASIPLILDEFKPQEMNQNTYDRFKLMLRDAYNCRNVERGGGNNENKDYRAVHTTQLSAPICFIAESAESESALMERVVMLTLVKPPVVKAQKYLGHFMSAVRNKEVLGILGSYIAASIVKTYSLSKLEAEFMPIYNRSRKEMMLQEGDDVSAMSQHELASKSGAKERTVYNYSVVKFGLFKLKTLLSNIYGEEFNARFDSLIGSTDSTVVALQEQTVPEWLKVMNTFADLAAIGNSEALHKLVENQDYAYVVYNGRSCIELYLRACYFKYRTYVAMSRSKPLFPNESSFLHAMNNIPALEAKGLCVELDCPGGSHIYALKELRSAGFMSPGKQ